MDAVGEQSPVPPVASAEAAEVAGATTATTTTTEALDEGQQDVGSMVPPAVGEGTDEKDERGAVGDAEAATGMEAGPVSIDDGGKEELAKEEVEPSGEDASADAAESTPAEADGGDDVSGSAPEDDKQGARATAAGAVEEGGADELPAAAEGTSAPSAPTREDGADSADAEVPGAETSNSADASGHDDVSATKDNENEAGPTEAVPAAEPSVSRTAAPASHDADAAVSAPGDRSASELVPNEPKEGEAALVASQTALAAAEDTPSADAHHQVTEDAGPAGSAERDAQGEEKDPGEEESTGEAAGMVEVELSVLPEKYVHRQRWAPETTAQTVLDDVASLLGLPRESLSLFTLGRGGEGVGQREAIASYQTVGSMDADGASGKVHMELFVDTATARPLQVKRAADLAAAGGDPAALALAGQMRVEVDMGNESKPKQIVVQIEYAPSAMQKMQFIGGYRNKRSGCVYHHACVQTEDDGRRGGKAPKAVSSTQTYKMVAAGIQTAREVSTQMRRSDLLIDEEGDVEVVPGPYVTSEEHLQRKLASIIIIQCYARGYLARKLARRLRHEKLEREMADENERQLRAYELERRRKFEIERRMHPKSHEDFAILRRELEAWKAQELSRIRLESEQSGGEMPEDVRHQRMLALLHKETKLLQTIDRLKIHASSDNRDVKTAMMLSEMAQPKGWALKDGDTIDVHTPFTIRARELMQLYNALRLPLLTMDERLDVLLHVKWTVKEFDCNLTREIVSLVDREADLLNRGRDVQKLVNLRKRTANLFLEFVSTPEFNPESERFRLIV